MSFSSDAEIGELLPRCNVEMNNLANLSNMQYNNFSVNNDDHTVSPDPDNFLQEKLFLPNPVSCYHFPDSPLMYTCSPDPLSVISLNINSLPQNLSSFVDECIELLKQQFDAMAFCESKLTDDIEELYYMPNYRLFSNNRSSDSLSLCTRPAELFSPNGPFGHGPVLRVHFH